jgi:hypothetical protein
MLDRISTAAKLSEEGDGEEDEDRRVEDRLGLLDVGRLGVIT